MVNLKKMFNFVPYVRERIETKHFLKLLACLLRLRQRNHHFPHNSEMKQKVHVPKGMGCCFVLSCRRVVVPVVRISDGIVLFFVFFLKSWCY